MSYTVDPTTKELVISGWESGIASSPYLGIANMRNMNNSYYPGVAYVNYKRQAATLGGTNYIDNYPSSSFAASFSLYSGASQEYVGQPFYNGLASTLGSAQFYLSKTGSPTGNVTASVFPATQTSDGQYVPTNNNFTVSVLAVGGGGGGANAVGSLGGGGGGQVKVNTSLGIQAEAFTVIVGAGGVGSGSGGTSSFSTLVSASGGSGSPNDSYGGTSGSSNAGGAGVNDYGGGGGGDSTVGGAYSGTTGGAGGDGTSNSLSGTATTYGGGGGGGTISGGTGGTGGTGGGGIGNGGAGTANTGGGGGGGGGNGGSGIVIISVPTGTLTATGGTKTTVGGNDIYTFTSNGTWTVTSVPTALATSNNVNIATAVTTTNALVTFTFPTPPTLTAKTFYIITVQYTGGDSSDYLNVGYGTTLEYINNTSLYSTNGTVWGAQGTPSVNNLIYYAISSTAISMSNPVQSAQSPAGLNYILDTNGNVWKQSAVNSSTFNFIANGPGRIGNGAGGIAYWNDYLVVFGDNVIEFCGDGTGDAGITSLNWNLNLDLQSLTGTSRLPLFYLNTVVPTTTTISAFDFAVTEYDQVVFSGSSGSVPPAPIVYGQVYYATSTATSGNPFSISATAGGTNISFTTAGTTSSDNVYISILPIQLPNGNLTDFKFTAQLVPSPSTAPTGTIGSYTLPNGTLIKGVWVLATGVYNIVDQLGNNLAAAFTNGSGTVAFVSPTTQYVGLVDLKVQVLNPSVTNYRPRVSSADGNIYFANGRQMGRILSENVNTTFDPSNPNSYVVDYAAFDVLDPNDSIVDSVDLLSTMVVAGQEKIYTWDYVSPSSSAPVPIDEPIFRLVNLMNNIYIFTNQKGNIYISNGSYVQLLKKIPDTIVNTIDPVWNIADAINHRSHLYFYASATDTSGNNLIGGVFSVIVSPAITGEIASGITMVSQNSAGLVPATGSLTNAVLINNEPSSQGQDSFYTAYSNGASTGVIDYNDTTLWSNNEPTIETDIIPIGTILDKKTLGQVQFKLDREMVAGDSISLYARGSLTESYTLIGTSSTAQLSENFPSTLAQEQWLQFKATFSCASSGSSRIPLREIRVQMV